MILELKSTAQVEIKKKFLRESLAGCPAFSVGDKRNDHEHLQQLLAPQRTVAWGNPDECEYFQVEHELCTLLVAA